MVTRRYMGMCCGVTTPLQQYRRSKQLHQGDYDLKSLIAYDSLGEPSKKDRVPETIL